MNHRSQKKSGCMNHMKSHMFKERMMNRDPDHQSTTAEMDYGSEELKALFSDWLLQLEEEIVSLAGKEKKISVTKVAFEFKISEQSAAFILERLAAQNRINIDNTPNERSE